MRGSVIEVRDTCLLEADTISCSGIVINNADQSFVLTHATIVSPYLTKRIPLLNKLLKEGMLMSDYFKDLKINVTCERAVNISDSKDQEKPSFATAVINLTVGSNYRNDFVSVPGVLQCIWKLDKLSDSLKNLFSINDDWKFAEVSQTEKESAESKDMPKYIFRLLSFFVLIKLSDRNIHSIATNRIDQHHSQLVVGNPLYVVGTPFGSLSPLVFMNSMSKGIVSNLAGKNQELILTDARCIPGTEGGGIYNGSPFDRRVFSLIVRFCILFDNTAILTVLWSIWLVRLIQMWLHFPVNSTGNMRMIEKLVSVGTWIRDYSVIYKFLTNYKYTGRWIYFI